MEIPVRRQRVDDQLHEDDENENLVITMLREGDFNCGASSQDDFILNYFLSNSPFPPSPAGRLEQLM